MQLALLYPVQLLLLHELLRELLLLLHKLLPLRNELLLRELLLHKLLH